MRIERGPNETHMRAGPGPRMLAGANPSSAQAQVDVLASLVQLLELPGGERYWKQARALADHLASRNLLGPQEQPLLDSIRQHTPQGR